MTDEKIIHYTLVDSFGASYSRVAMSGDNQEGYICQTWITAVLMKPMAIMM